MSTGWGEDLALHGLAWRRPKQLQPAERFGGLVVLDVVREQRHLMA